MKYLLIAYLLLATFLSPSWAAAQDGIEGRWTLSHRKPGVVEVETVQLLVVKGEGLAVTAEVSIPAVTVKFEGTFDPATGVLALITHKGPKSATMTLTLQGDRLRGVGDLPIGQLTFDGRRTEKEPKAPPAVRFDVPNPEESATGALPAELAAACHAAIEDAMRQASLVGVSVAIVVENRLVEVLSRGWEDFEKELPANARTMYRWASVSKPLTAIAALQLVSSGELELYGDVRELVPEYDKDVTITTRQLLAHNAGLPHYDDMKVRTIKEYNEPHPWTDRIAALDMFAETDLLFAPDYAFRYSTPGFVLLGAVIERAGKGTYVDQVLARICQPLGMKSMRPDYVWEQVAHRAAPYQSCVSGTLRQIPDDISWKLPAGGWMSTAGDMGRFAAGVMGPKLLDAELRDDMWTMHTDYGNGLRGYGLGITVAKWDGHRVLTHSGGQVGASTYMLCSPDTGHAVAIMANTEGGGVSDLAFELLGLLIE